MMTLDQLYERAYNDGLEIDYVHMRELRAMSFPEGWIALDLRKFESLVELKCVLAHEIGHCETGSFYNIYSHYDIKEKCERKANRRAVEILMPINEVRKAIRRGIREPWAMAEHFNVTQQFAQIALEIYEAELLQHNHKHVVGLPPMIKASDMIKSKTRHVPSVRMDVRINAYQTTIMKNAISDLDSWFFSNEYDCY